MSDEVELARIGRLAELGMVSSNLAHEQRQPLFAIKSLAQLLQLRVDAEAQPLVTQLLEQVDYLQRLVEGIGSYARAPGAELQPVDARAVVQRAVDLLVHRARRKDQALRVQAVDGLQAASAEPTALTQVVVNLVQNALDASPPGAEVVVDLAMRDGGVCITVQDQGGGIPAELLEKVFEPFFTTKPAGRGTGLGLSISRQLMQNMGGSLDFAPAPVGSRAELLLRGWG